VLVTLTSLARGQDAPSPKEPAPASSESSQERAQAWFEEGQAAYARGEFAIAAALFRAVYVATPAPEILYDLAQAERRAKQCKAALAHYEEYLTLEHGVAPNDVEEKVAEVRGCADKEEGAARSSTTKTELPPPAPAAEHPTQQSHDTTLRAVAYGSIAGAVLTAAFGTAFLIHANSASQHLEELNTPGAQWDDRYAAYQSELDLNRAAAIGFFVASGVMAATATTLLLVRWPGETRTNTATIAVGPAGGGLGATCRLSF
jgi:tetratricopeptide (TPR) repeat protein